MRTRFLLSVVIMVVAGWLVVSAASAAQQETPAEPGAPTAGAAPTEAGTTTPATEPSPDAAETPAGVEGFQFSDLWAGTTLLGWLIPFLGLVVGLVAGRGVAFVLRWLGQRFEARGWTVRSEVLMALISPANLALLALGFALGLAAIGIISVPFWSSTVLLLFTVAVLWYAYNVIFVVELVLDRALARTGSAMDETLGPLIRKTLRVVLLVFGVLFVLKSVFGQDVGALLAGLGIVTLAVSLAAQDSLKNLFGSITILGDKPFKIGERIVYGGYDGAVEEIGFRSTKVRTLTGHLVTIPNSIIVNNPVENIGRRPSIRRTLNVTITYDTPRVKIEEAVEIIRNILEEEDLREPIHQTIDGNEFPPRVYFNDYNADSLNIFVIYWYVPPAYWDYLEHAQRLNLRIFEEYEKAGIEFAFPTQTLYLAGDPKRRLALEMLGRDLPGPG